MRKHIRSTSGWCCNRRRCRGRTHGGTGEHLTLRLGFGRNSKRRRRRRERLHLRSWYVAKQALPLCVCGSLLCSYSLLRSLLRHDVRVRLRRAEDLVVLSLAKLLLHIEEVLGVAGVGLRHREQKVGFLLIVSEATSKDTTGTTEATAKERTASKGVEQTALALCRIDIDHRVSSKLEDFLERFRSAFHTRTYASASTYTLEDVEGLLALGNGPGNVTHRFAEHTASQQELTSRIRDTANCTNTESDSAITFATVSHGLAISLSGLLEDVRCSRETDSADLRGSTGGNPTGYVFGTSLKTFLHELVEGTGSQLGLGCVGRSVQHTRAGQKKLLLCGIQCLSSVVLLGSFVERLLDGRLAEEAQNRTARCTSGSGRRADTGTDTGSDNRLNNVGAETTNGCSNPVKDAVLTDVLNVALVNLGLGEVGTLICQACARFGRTSKHKTVTQRLLGLIKTDVEVVGNLLEEAGAADTLNILCVAGRIDLLPVTFRERSFLVGILRQRHGSSVVVIVKGVTANEELLGRRAVSEACRPAGRKLRFLNKSLPLCQTRLPDLGSVIFRRWKRRGCKTRGEWGEGRIERISHY